MRKSAFLALALAISSVAFADNWPQWRGPSLDGSSREKELPLDWSQDHNIAWKLPLPARSGATPIVWGERIFLNVALDEREGDLELWCVDRDSGAVLWRRPLGGGNVFKYKQNMSSPSPVTDGETVWVMTGTGILKAFGFEGQELWSRDIQAEYGLFGLNWGYASSPLLFGDSLYVQVLHGMTTDDPSYLLRIDKRSGQTIWRVERPTQAVFESPDAYTTPGLLLHDGSTEIIISGGDAVTGHDPETGKELWRATVLNPNDDKTQRIVASPLIGDGMIYVFGKRGPVIALRPGGRGDVTRSHVVWRMEKGTDVPTPVTDGGLIYMVTDRGMGWCLTARTGQVVWGPERLGAGPYSASPILADGRIYATNEAGVTTVFKAGTEFEILAKNDLEGYTLGSPAVSDGQIFIRTADHLYAIGRRRAR
jgi:outer membrane protein assembly factor BamB